MDKHHHLPIRRLDFLLVLSLAMGLSACSSPTAVASTKVPLPVLTSTPTFTPAPTFTPTPTPLPAGFDGERAWQDVQYQVGLGPRIPESTAHAQVITWIQAELKAAGWQVDVQESKQLGHPVKNIIARWGEGRPWIVVGAHYDSRLVADQDPDPTKRTTPVPGANDGASGVAVLLELARVLPAWLEAGSLPDQGTPGAPGLTPPGQVWLAFFDAEDNGRVTGWDWILGSTALVSSLQEKPDAAVVLDMIGDANLNIYQEQNSDPNLSRQIWDQAAALGYGANFIPEAKFRLLDDHLPFIQAGIPAVDLIDFDYPYWHTTSDTPDKVAPESLKAVGDTVLAWLSGGKH